VVPFYVTGETNGFSINRMVDHRKRQQAVARARGLELLM
jgi:hypothetical protein